MPHIHKFICFFLPVRWTWRTLPSARLRPRPIGVWRIAIAIQAVRTTSFPWQSSDAILHEDGMYGLRVWLYKPVVFSSALIMVSCSAKKLVPWRFQLRSWLGSWGQAQGASLSFEGLGGGSGRSGADLLGQHVMRFGFKGFLLEVRCSFAKFRSLFVFLHCRMFRSECLNLTVYFFKVGDASHDTIDEIFWWRVKCCR